MKRILINATQAEELRVAIVDGQKLHDLDIEVQAKEQRKSNIYKGRITRVEASLEAAFVDYGAERHGFLPLKEVSRSYFKGNPGSGRVNIREVLSEGQEIIVQVEKEERDKKGAALTTFISLAGRYLVLMPNNPRAGGVSRRVEGDERSELREAMGELTIPDGMGAIVRTNGVGRSAEELQWDLDYLVQLWQSIEQASGARKAPFLIYQESNIIIRALRDYFRKDIGEVIVDNPKIYDEAREFMQQVMPQSLQRLKLYTDDIPLFTRYQVESQIETAFRREVRLPSGGSVVIDRTEALTSIDINSAKATSGGGIEETAFNTNLEAADEIARQLRLRDLGGLIVIDFIDMNSGKNQQEVENRLRDATEVDRARVQIGRISRFGLLEMSRQRLRPALAEFSHIVCPRCSGQGNIRGVESLALSVLRLIEEEAMKDSTGRIVAQLPVPVATFLLNEKRGTVSALEQRNGVHITLVPNPEFDTPLYEIKRIREDQLTAPGNSEVSYKIPSELEAETVDSFLPKPVRVTQGEQAAVQRITPTRPAPVPLEATTVAARSWPMMWAGMLLWLKGLFASEAKAQAETPRPAQRPARQEPRRDNNRRNDSRGQRQDSSSRRSDDRQGNRQQGRNRNQPGQSRTESNPRQDQSRRQEPQRQPQPARGASEQKPQAANPAGDNAQQRPQPSAPAAVGTMDADGQERNSRRGRRRRGRRGRGAREGAPETGQVSSTHQDANGNVAETRPTQPRPPQPSRTEDGMPPMPVAAAMPAPMPVVANSQEPVQATAQVQASEAPAERSVQSYSEPKAQAPVVTPANVPTQAIPREHPAEVVAEKPKAEPAPKEESTPAAAPEPTPSVVADQTADDR
jgi:ribonuclease E